MKQLNIIAFTCLFIGINMCALQAQNGANILIDDGPCDPIILIFCPSGVVNAANATDHDLTTYATMKTTLGILSQSYLEMGFSNPAPAGSTVAVYVGDDVALNIDVLATIHLYLLNSSGGIITQKDGLALADIKLASEGRGIAKIKVPKGNTATAVRITLGGLVSLNNQLKVYGVVHAPSALPVLANSVVSSGPCNPIIPLSCPAGVVNPNASIDASKSNYADLIIPLGITANAYLELGFPSAAPGSSTVAFSCATNSGLLDIAVLNNLKLALFDASGNMIASKNGFSLAEIDLIGSDKFNAKIRVPAGMTASRARISLQNTVGVLSEVLVYNAHYTPEINFESYFKDGKITSQSAMELYPNPANDLLYINTGTVNNDGIASVYSMEGQLLFSYQLENAETAEMPVISLDAGMYILSVSASDYRSSGVFIIQR